MPSMNTPEIRFILRDLFPERQFAAWTCLCGCGYNAPRRFRPGHDARLKGMLLRSARAGNDNARDLLSRFGWIHFLTGTGANRTVADVVTNRAMDSDTRTFGVEIECAGITCQQAAQALTDAGFPARYEGYNHATRNGWKVVYDASVSNSAGSGVEVVSPILRGEDGIQQVHSVMEALRNAGANVNVSCGIHVHVGVNDLTREQVARALRIYHDNRHAIASILPPSRRNGRWCATWAEGDVARVEQYAQQGRALHLAQRGRYRNVNLQSLPRYGTVEFRQHSGSLNGTKVENWVRLLIAMVEAAKQGEFTTTTRSIRVLTESLGLDSEWYTERAEVFA